MFEFGWDQKKCCSHGSESAPKIMADFDCDIVADDNGFPVHIKFTGSRIELLGEDGKKTEWK